MKSGSIFLLASASLALATPSHPHNHRRFHELKARDDSKITVVSTVSVYELNGKLISYDELEEGLKNGTLVLDGPAPDAPSSSAPATSSKPAPPVLEETVSSSSPPSTSSPTTQPPSPTTTPAATPSKAQFQNKAVQPASSSSSSSSPPTSSSSSDSSSGDDDSSSSSSSTGLNTPYDNSLSCSEFPSAFGAVPLPSLGLGGFTAVVTPGSSSSAGYDNLGTANTGGCTEGAFCSFSCPAGYLKTQWPPTQGATGQSVGGLLCKNGKLTLTRPDVPVLCQSAMTPVQVTGQNKLSGLISICRTDYPGQCC